MDTTTAAQQAGVTVATVRTWCRIGAVAAVKRAGRWIIDAASLAHRITLGKKTFVTNTDYRVDDETAIRVHAKNNPLPGTEYYARQVINGYELSDIPSYGSTPDEAYRKHLALITETHNEERAAAQLQATGLYSDLTTGPRAGIHTQMQSIAPSPARDGECHYCGLDSDTCDCR
jgi:hypothetical protein